MRKNRFIWISAIMLLSLLGCGNAEAGDGGTYSSRASVESRQAESGETSENRTEAESGGNLGSQQPADSLSVASRNPDDSAGGGMVASAGSQNSQGKGTEAKKSGKKYQAPEFAEAVFHEDQAKGDKGAKVDLSAVSQGYVAVSATSDARLKFLVIKDDVQYQYNIASDGTPSVFPLQSGDGDYTFHVMKNTTSGKYAYLYTTQAKVTLEDEFQPYLRPSDFVNYDEESDCAKTAAELAENAEDALGVVGEVFAYISENVTYDRDKASQVQNGSMAGYLPDPDDTLATKKGICFDYAALTAAMLRSQGIPTKMVFGYVSPDDLYHAWNMFYTEETGWVTVEYSVKQNSWNRLDLTFSANGKDSEFIGDGGNYTDTKYY